MLSIEQVFFLVLILIAYFPPSLIVAIDPPTRLCSRGSHLRPEADFINYFAGGYNLCRECRRQDLVSVVNINPGTNATVDPPSNEVKVEVDADTEDGSVPKSESAKSDSMNGYDSDQLHLPLQRFIVVVSSSQARATTAQVVDKPRRQLVLFIRMHRDMDLLKRVMDVGTGKGSGRGGEQGREPSYRLLKQEGELSYRLQQRGREPSYRLRQ